MVNKNMLKKYFSIVLAFLMIFGLTVPEITVEAAGFTTTPMVAAGEEHSLALRSDGTVWAWGWNSNGQLGDGTTIDSHAPVQVQGLNNIKAISANGNHSIALRNDGTLWAWGSNWSGQLGDNTTIDRLTPVQVQGLNSVTAISAGGVHTVALRDDGTVWTWGRNQHFGILGDGTTTDRHIPGQVHDLNNITAISACGNHTLALRNDGTVWAWGMGAFGRLGDGTTGNRFTPVKVQGLSNITAISASVGNIALRNDGTVWAWGGNGHGQLGDGTTTDRHTPVQAQGINNVIAISTSASHAVAVRGDGTVWAWGSNRDGQLGNGTNTNSVTPVQVQGLNNVTAISANGNRTIAIQNDSTVESWGHNRHGKLGDGTTTFRNVPVQVVDVNGVAFNLGPDTPTLPQPTPSPPPTTQPNTVTVTWDASGGTGNLTESRTPGEAVGFLPPVFPPPPPPPSVFEDDPRHIFIGWFDAQGNRITEATTIPPNDITFYARWNNPGLNGRHLSWWYYSTNIPLQFAPGFLGGTPAERAAMARSINYWNNTTPNTPINFFEDNSLPIRNTVTVASSDNPFLGFVSWPELNFGPNIANFYLFMIRNNINNYADSRGFDRNRVFTSVFSHELGHVIGLEDADFGSPLGGGCNQPYCVLLPENRFSGAARCNSSVMNYDACLNTVMGPTLFDIVSVNLLYSGMHHDAAGFTVGDGGIGVTHIAARYPQYNSIAHLASDATDIVRVEVLDERTELLNTWLEDIPIVPYNIYTVYRLRVIEAFQGNATPGDILEVRQLGGQHSDRSVINAVKAPIAVGDDVVMFLRASYIVGYPSVLLNPLQTIYRFTDDDVLESAHPGNGLVLTVQYLEQISEGTLSPDEPTQPPTQPAIPNNHSSWAEPELRRAAEQNLIPATLQFAHVDLTQPVTRAEFAGIVVMTFENLANTVALPTIVSPFADTRDPYVLRAFNAGLMVGVSDTNFDPNTLLNREQAATALTRAFKRATIPTWTFATDANYPLNFVWPAPFADDEYISEWARESVYFMAANEIILGTGNNMFSPRATTTEQQARGYAIATREQALIIALRMVESLG